MKETQESLIARLWKSAQNRAEALFEQAKTHKTDPTFSSIIRAFGEAAQGRAQCLEIIYRQEQEIQQLKARLDALENPQPVIIEKKVRSSQP